MIVGPVIVRLKAFIADSMLLSVTRTVNLALVATLGVPLITPFVLKFKPDGRWPEEIDHV